MFLILSLALNSLHATHKLLHIIQVKLSTSNSHGFSTLVGV